MLAAVVSFFAQIDVMSAQLTQFGVLGTVLAWFMFRTESRMKNMETSIDRLSQALLLKIVTDPYVHDETRKRAQSLMSEIEKKGPPQ